MPPAARFNDMHTCPLFAGPVPHVGGPILPPCEPTVLIGNMAAARVTDKAVCLVGGPDVIVQGSPTVIIGNQKAARIGDTTAHTGKIVAGCLTVIIGDSGSGAQTSAMTDARDAGAPFVKKCPGSGGGGT
jgi:uncharacterized Zn-binding protein involved in type VI secretion